jgi:hypothetical protein
VEFRFRFSSLTHELKPPEARNMVIAVRELFMGTGLGPDSHPHQFDGYGAVEWLKAGTP